jgi:hypothetical protein
VVRQTLHFGGYNTANIETNFNGRTVPLQATATVVQDRHITLNGLADAIDSSYDSAVFLDGGSFNIGVELLDPSGATLPAEINVCDNVPQVITASVSDPNMTYQWFSTELLFRELPLLPLQQRSRVITKFSSFLEVLVRVKPTSK